MLDRICEKHDAWPDLLKLDVEGAEQDVLRGGERAAQGALAIDIEVAFAPLRIRAPLSFRRLTPTYMGWASRLPGCAESSGASQSAMSSARC